MSFDDDLKKIKVKKLKPYKQDQGYRTRRFHAAPMNLGDFNIHCGFTIPEDANPELEGYLVVWPTGERSWSNTYQFESVAEIDDPKPTTSRVQQLEAAMTKIGYIVAKAPWSKEILAISDCLSEAMPDMTLEDLFKKG